MYVYMWYLSIFLVEWHFYVIYFYVTVFALKFILSDIRLATSALFCLSFIWNIFFYLLFFSLCVSLNLNRVSYRVFGCCFLICLATLCLFIEEFNPFTFKVIIYREGFPMAIFLFSDSLVILLLVFSCLTVLLCILLIFFVLLCLDFSFV